MLGWFLYFITRSPNGSSELTLFIDNSSYRIIPLMSPFISLPLHTHAHTDTHRHRRTDTQTQTHKHTENTLPNYVT